MQTGPLEVNVTVGIVGGRPEPIGVEIWAVDPATLPEWATGMSPAAAKKRWTFEPDAPPAAIRTTDLRLPLGRLVEWSVVNLRWTFDTLTSTRIEEVDSRDRPALRRFTKRVLELTEPEPEKPRGRRPLPRSHYENVAAVYRQALSDNQDPTQAVKEHFTISKSQAAKWIYRCRRYPLNLLDPTVRGRRAGGPEIVDETSKPIRRFASSHDEDVAAVRRQALPDNRDPAQAVTGSKARRGPITRFSPITRDEATGGLEVADETAEPLPDATAASTPRKRARK
jgi:hypothetical protein